eukprot:scaffold8303_cov30-Tisochrysis_lutea.AAC.4
MNRPRAHSITLLPAEAKAMPPRAHPHLRSGRAQFSSGTKVERHGEISGARAEVQIGESCGGH